MHNADFFVLGPRSFPEEGDSVYYSIFFGTIYHETSTELRESLTSWALFKAGALEFMMFLYFRTLETR